MIKLQPSSIENLQGELATCNKVDDVDLSQLSRLVEHVPEDMTATVEAGMTLVDFQQHLAKGGQWLPLVRRMAGRRCVSGGRRASGEG